MDPYSMCSKQECDERIRTNEVSIWETTIPVETPEASGGDGGGANRPTTNSSRRTTSATPRCGIHTFLDPRKAVAKYRRSAAGTTTDARAPPRSLAALLGTTHYLVRTILMAMASPESQSPPTPTHPRNGAAAVQDEPRSLELSVYISNTKNADSFLSRVAFFEDRMRAVQVDLVRSSNNTTTASACQQELQRLAIRSHILILYLLADSSSFTPSSSSSAAAPSPKNDDPTCQNNYYERSFGQAALQTALTSYWNGGGEQNSNSCKQQRTSDSDDEVLSLSLLNQLNQQLLAQHHQQQAQNTEGVAAASPSEQLSMPSLVFALSELSRKHMTIFPHQPLDDDDEQTFVLFPWTLQLVSCCCLGHWQAALSMILEDRGGNTPPSRMHDSDECASSTENKKWHQFSTLARCCLAPSLTYIRWRVLQTLNMTLLKNEAVSGDELARILCIRRHGTSKNHSLPTWNNANEEALDHVSPSAQVALGFGQAFGLPLDKDGTKLVFKVHPIQACHSSSPSQTWNIRQDDGDVLDSDTDNDLVCSSDGIFLPSAKWMESVLFSESTNNSQHELASSFD